ncbi:hypothetical protein EOD42_05770 [Rhodovarius crocodyli]|uniref:Uncharacterized protein n=1 Tax=Rhodovarius crocodyli TaxID=1979269 RepID=A0A437MPP5_9PROT|nr:hypothetical protein [Rhodovarius crocodyli]RVT99585.1 hypothetical protein EOD42_05770 [Rhodovarius crocodyli]
MSSDDPIFAPPPTQGLAVRIMDLSGANGSDPLEVVTGFGSLGHANTFARRYVRDSLERCRTPGMSADEVLAAWFAFGEDAQVEAGAEGGSPWRTESELHDFAGRPLEDDAEQRDWRMIDPRRDGDHGIPMLMDGLDDDEDDEEEEDEDEDDDADEEDEA